MIIVQDIDDSDVKLTSDVFDDFKEALEVLYILANISGRIKFAAAWPHAAAYVLGADLLKYDCDGTDNRERRAALEVQAEERRLEFLAILDRLEEQSVVGGTLQVPYVKDLIERWGRDLALYIYSLKIVNRFIAPPPAEEIVEVPIAEPLVQRSHFSSQTTDEPAVQSVRPAVVTTPLSIGVTQDVVDTAPEEAVSITFMSAKKEPDEDKSGTETKPEETKE
jgi:hypothetical protein